MTDDPYLEIEEKAPAGWNNQFCACAEFMFPPLKGAHVADILGILDDSDWGVGPVEAFMEKYEKEFSAYTGNSVRLAIMYARVARINARAAVHWLAIPKE